MRVYDQRRAVVKVGDVVIQRIQEANYSVWLVVADGNVSINRSNCHEVIGIKQATRVATTLVMPGGRVFLGDADSNSNDWSDITSALFVRTPTK